MQKFKNSTARKSTAKKKKTVSSKRTLDDDNDTGDDSDADYVPSRCLLRPNVAESGDEIMCDRSAVENTAGFDAMEDEVKSGMDNGQEHAKKLSGATEKPTSTVMTEASKVRMDLFEKE